MNASNCTTCSHLATEHGGIAGCLVETAPGSYCTCKALTLAPASGLEEGRARRDEGMERAGTGTPGVLASDWRAKAATAMDELAASGEEFSADQLVEKAGPPPHPNMLGPTFANAARADLINAVGFRQATRASAHARIQRTWKGKG